MGKTAHCTYSRIIHIYMETCFTFTGFLYIFLYLKSKLFLKCFILLAIAIRWYFKEKKNMVLWPIVGVCISRAGTREKASFPTFSLLGANCYRDKSTGGEPLKGVRVPACWKPSGVISCF